MWIAAAASEAGSGQLATVQRLSLTRAIAAAICRTIERSAGSSERNDTNDSK